MKIFIGRSRTGEAWHATPQPGTAFPVAYCGTFIERRTMHSVERPADGIAFHPWQCSRCRNAITKESA
jgi:hypothetical protein